MSTRTLPYVGASVARTFSGLIPEGPAAGRSFTVTLYRGMASHGAQTGYQHRPQAWLVLEADIPAALLASPDPDDARYWRDARYHCWTFSGKRLALAEERFDSMVADLTRECAS